MVLLCIWLCCCLAYKCNCEHCYMYINYIDTEFHYLTYLHTDCSGSYDKIL